MLEHLKIFLADESGQDLVDLALLMALLVAASGAILDEAAMWGVRGLTALQQVLGVPDAIPSDSTPILVRVICGMAAFLLFIALIGRRRKGRTEPVEPL